MQYLGLGKHFFGVNRVLAASDMRLFYSAPPSGTPIESIVEVRGPCNRSILATSADSRCVQFPGSPRVHGLQQLFAVGADRQPGLGVTLLCSQLHGRVAAEQPCKQTASKAELGRVSRGLMTQGHAEAPEADQVRFSQIQHFGGLYICRVDTRVVCDGSLPSLTILAR